MTSRESDFDRLVESSAFRYKLNELRLIQKYLGRPQDVKVSVIMPTWNRAFIIGRAIDSILRQTYGNFEIIVSDDGSADGTSRLMEMNYDDDDRVIYIENKHTGVSHARNVGLQKSTGQIIAYLDSDNVWSENYLLLMVNSLIDNPVADTVYCGIRVIDKTGQREYVRLAHYDRERIEKRNYVDLNVFMHRRSLFEMCGGFDEALTALVDWDLVLRYTKDHPPLVLECELATYYLDVEYDHISYREDLQANYKRIRALYEKK